MKYVFLCWLVLASSVGVAGGNVFKIAFGSCAKQNKPQTIWDEIDAQAPDAFLFIGDNIYADTRNMDEMWRRYQQLGAQPSFAAFRQKRRLFATWDDHDYGENDAGVEYPRKRESQGLFFKFWGRADPATKSREGVYQSALLHEKGLKVQLILLDTRYHRSNKQKRAAVGFLANTDPRATVLGEQQWAWLAAELRKSADVRILASSIQFLSDDHHFEKWGNFPKERQKMLRLIADTKANGVVFISGDRHSGEISKLPAGWINYDLYDFTSSGLTNPTIKTLRHERNDLRLVKTNAHNIRNFGVIKVTKIKRGVKLILELLDYKSRILESTSFVLYSKL